MTRFQLYLFGSFQANINGRPLVNFRSDKIRALLAYLAIEADRPHRRETLAALLWSEFPHDVALRNLRLSLSRLRQTLAPNTAELSSENPTVEAAMDSLLLITGEGVQMQIDGRDRWVDVGAFDSLLAICATHPHQDQARCLACIGRLAVAVDLYQEDFMPGLALADAPLFDEWRLIEGEKRHQSATASLETLSTYYATLGSYRRAEEYARRQVILDPLQEAAHRQLMRVLASSGQRNAALEQFDSCCDMLQRELRVKPAAETEALYQQIKSNQFEKWGADSSSIDSELLSHNLPAAMTPFIGRHAELEKLSALLLDPSYRLVTLMGEGGMGKTRLALAAAEKLRSHFPDGAWFISMESVTAVPTPEGPHRHTPSEAKPSIHHAIATAVAGSLGLTFSGPGELKAQLLDYLRRRDILLILDGFEHLLDGADLVHEILEMAPQSTILVTSRERLNFRTEYVMWVGGLSVPSQVDNLTVAHYSSIQLFAERADRTLGGFQLDADNLAEVVEICRLVDGLPLAIELAATWVEQLTCAEIVQAIHENIDFLATAARDAPARHRSMRAVFDHSWRLLLPAEQIILAKLTIFRGQFSQDAAVAVTGATAAELESLVNKSLLRKAAPKRYIFHELLRQFAEEKLQALTLDGRVATHSLESAHADFYLRYLAEREPLFNGEKTQQVVAELRREVGNIQRAWHWAVDQADIGGIGQSLDGLARFYHLVSLLQEGKTAFKVAAERVSRFIDSAGTPDIALQHILMRLLVEQARFLYALASYDETIAIAQTAVELAQTHSDVRGEASGYLCWAQALFRQGHYELALTYFEKALTLAHKASLGQVEADSLYGLGLVAKEQGNYERARQYFRQALQMYREAGNRQQESFTLSNIGMVSIQLANYETAHAYLEDALRSSREIGNRWGEEMVLDNLGFLCTLLSNYTKAKTYLENALRIAREIGERRGEAETLYHLAFLHNRMGDYTAAVDYGQKSLLIAQYLGAPDIEAFAWIYLGGSLIELDRLTEAADAYEQAVTLRRDLGQINLEIEALAGLAQVLLAQNELTQAGSHVETILNHLERGSLEGTVEPASVYLTCYQVLQATQDPRAPYILKEGQDFLQEGAAKISDKEMRHSFLHDVRVHRELSEVSHLL